MFSLLFAAAVLGGFYGSDKTQSSWQFSTNSAWLDCFTLLSLWVQSPSTTSQLRMACASIKQGE